MSVVWIALFIPIYIDDELWTISISTGLDINEISKIIESIEAK